MSKPRKPSLSPSASGMWHQCPKKWEFRYIKGIKEPSTRATLLGTFVHEILEELFALPAAERTLEAARVCGREAWPNVAGNDEFVALGLSADEVSEFHKDAWRLVNTYFDMEDPSSVEPLGLEMELDVDVEGVPFFGYIDRVDQEGDKRIVTDYKTGKSPKPQYSGDKLNQVNFYAAALEATDGKPVNGVRIIFLGDGRELTADVTPETVAETQVLLQNTWAEITEAKETGNFPHKVGPLCGWCYHVEDCEAGAAEVRSRFIRGRMRAGAPAVAKLGLQ